LFLFRTLFSSSSPHALPLASSPTQQPRLTETRQSPIKSETDAASSAGKVILKLGIFEKIPRPEWESFVRDRHEWVPGHEGIVQYKDKTGGEKV